MLTKKQYYNVPGAPVCTPNILIKGVLNNLRSGRILASLSYSLMLVAR